MCIAWKCLEWPTIFIFFHSRGIYLNLLQHLPEIRDTVRGNHAINAGHFFLKTKDIFMDYDKLRILKIRLTHIFFIDWKMLRIKHQGR